MFFKITENGVVSMIGKANTVPTIATEITSEKYAELQNVIKSKPQDTFNNVFFYPWKQNATRAEKERMTRKCCGMYRRICRGRKSRRYR